MNKKIVFNPEIFIPGHAYVVDDNEGRTTMLLQYYGSYALIFLDSCGHRKEYRIDDIDIENPIFTGDLNRDYEINKFNVVKEIYDMKDIDDLFTVGFPYKIISRGCDSWSRTNERWFGLFLRYDMITNSLIFVQVKPENISSTTIPVAAVSIPIKDIESNEYIEIEALYDWDDEENNISDIIRQQKVDGGNNE